MKRYSINPARFRNGLLIIGIFFGSLTKGQIISTIAGIGGVGGTTIGDGGPASSAQIGDPVGFTFDRAGNMYIAEGIGNRIRKISASGVVTTIAGSASVSGTSGFSGDGGPATAALISAPHGIAVDTSGNVIFADQGNNRIRKISSTGIISTLAGNDTLGFSGDGGPASLAQISNPMGLSLDKNGNLYFADCYNYRIRKITPSGIISTVAGSGTAGYSGDGGQATAAEMYFVYAVDVDTANNIYIVDFSNQCVRKVNSSGIISTIAGNGTAGFSGDGGPGTAAMLYNPWSARPDNFGNVYIADDFNQRIRKVSAAGIISTVAGSGGMGGGFSGDGGPATSALMYLPHDVYVAATGTVYLSDGGNGRIRMISCSLPLTAGVHGTDTLCPGHTTTLTDSTSGGTWVSSNTSVATVSSTGVVTSVAPGTVNMLYIVTNSCGSDTATFPFSVRTPGACNTSVNMVGNEHSLTLFPNPNTGSFTFNLSSGSNEDVQIIITNILGEKIKQMKTRTNKETAVQLNVPSGIYFVSAATANEQYMEKIVVE